MSITNHVWWHAPVITCYHKNVRTYLKNKAKIVWGHGLSGRGPNRGETQLPSKNNQKENRREDGSFSNEFNDRVQSGTRAHYRIAIGIIVCR
jgi:hypothetical protein